MNLFEQWFAPDPTRPAFLTARWIWLRALGGIFFSAFYSLYFQIHGLIGPNGILPASGYLDAIRHALGWRRYWLIPSLLWINAGDRALERAGVDRTGRVGRDHVQSLAASEHRRRRHLLSLIHRGRAGLLVVSVGRHAARGGAAVDLSSRRAASGPASPPISRRRAPASSCCGGSGSASTSSRAS